MRLFFGLFSLGSWLLFFGVMGWTGLQVVWLQSEWPEPYEVTLSRYLEAPPESPHVAISGAHMVFDDSASIEGTIAVTLALRPIGARSGPSIRLRTRDQGVLQVAQQLLEASQTARQAQTARQLYEDDADYRAFMIERGASPPDVNAAMDALVIAQRGARQFSDTERTYVGWVEDGVLQHEHAPSMWWAWTRLIVGGLGSVAGLLTIVGIFRLKH